MASSKWPASDCGHARQQTHSHRHTEKHHRRQRPGRGRIPLNFKNVAADVSPLIIPAGEKSEPTHVGCHHILNAAGATGRGARGWAMMEIKLGRIPHSALSIPHLNGSFPVRALTPSLSHPMGEGVRRTGEGASWNRCRTWTPSSKRPTRRMRSLRMR